MKKASTYMYLPLINDPNPLIILLPWALFSVYNTLPVSEFKTNFWFSKKRGRVKIFLVPQASPHILPKPQETKLLKKLNPQINLTAEVERIIKKVKFLNSQGSINTCLPRLQNPNLHHPDLRDTMNNALIPIFVFTPSLILTLIEEKESLALLNISLINRTL